jgi:hypothetical protein
VAGLVRGDALLLLEHGDRRLGHAAEQLTGDRQPDDAGADDPEVRPARAHAAARIAVSAAAMCGILSSMALSAHLVGGPHDGERIAPPAADPLPGRLFGIAFTDGARYARTERTTDARTGEPVLVLRHDTDGSLTRAAKIAVGVDPDAPARRIDCVHACPSSPPPAIAVLAHPIRR